MRRIGRVGARREGGRDGAVRLLFVGRPRAEKKRGGRRREQSIDGLIGHAPPPPSPSRVAALPSWLAAWLASPGARSAAFEIRPEHSSVFFFFFFFFLYYHGLAGLGKVYFTAKKKKKDRRRVVLSSSQQRSSSRAL